MTSFIKTTSFQNTLHYDIHKYVIISQTKVDHWTSCYKYRIYMPKHMLMLSYINIETVICMSSSMYSYIHKISQL